MKFATKHDEIQYNSSLEFIDLIPSEYKRIADIGSGPGYQAEELRKRGHNVVCVDYKKPTATAKSVEWQHPDTCTLSNLDAVWSHHCLEHIQDPISALIKWGTYLKPGGALLLTVPEIQTTMSSGHINNFNLPQLMYILAVSGYTTHEKHFNKTRSHLRAWVHKSTNYDPTKGIKFDLAELADLNLFPDSVATSIQETGRFDNSTMHFVWNERSYAPVANSKQALNYVLENMWYRK